MTDQRAARSGSADQSIAERLAEEARQRFAPGIRHLTFAVEDIEDVI